MSETSTISCPECHTAQRADAPFCDNCGYRLGRPDTALEGQPVVPKDRVDAGQVGGEHPAVTLGSTNAEATSSADLMAETVREEPVDPDQLRQATAEPHRPESTEVEGVPAVPGGPPTATEQVVDRSVDASAGFTGAHPTPTGTRWVPVLAFWIVSLVAVAMVTEYFVRKGGTDEAGEGPVAVEPSRVAVAGGPFRKGLDESVRSFILLHCLKVADDQDECEQDELLAGEFPEETASVDAFELDATEVTVRQWNDCVESEVCAEIDTRSCKVYTHQGRQISLRVPKSLQAPEAPVTCVSRSEAEAYCEFAGGRLPTNDEWERAARGTDARLFPWGTTWEPIAANWGETDIARMPVVGKIDGFEWVAPPGQFPEGKSPAGAYDMAGNVAEWVAGDDPLAGIARGGAWTSTPFDLRTTARLELDAIARRTDVGFRCAY